MPTLHDVATPALVLDRTRLENNLLRMREALRPHAVLLRPHLKTAKSVDVARLALGGNGPITVSTIAEAECFAGHGFDDILLAVSATPEKAHRIAPLVAAGVRVTLLTDDIDTASELVGNPVLIEIDCGEARSGVDPDGDKLLAIAATLSDSLAGVLTHAGHSYRGRSAADFAVVAEQERAAVVHAADRLRAAGFRCDTVSVGSTPTALFARDLTGVTEVRAGVYMFGDLFQAAIGSCSEADIAISVLATVIGHRREQGMLLLDAGALALSKDISTAQTDRDAGFGLVCDLDGNQSFGRAIVQRVYQEHGIAVTDGGWPWHELPIGSRVRILPNHACLTAAAHDWYQVVAGGVEVAARWDRCRGW